MSMQSGSIDADGLARTSDGKLYVTLGSGSAIDGATIGGVTPGAGTFTKVSVGSGTASLPSIVWTADDDSFGTGLYRGATNHISFTSNGVAQVDIGASSLGLQRDTALIWTTSATDPATTASAVIARVADNSLRFSATAVTTTSRTEMNKAVTAIANAVATSVLTITIPNAAHSASLLVRVTGSLGAGGAIGANEATATNDYVVAITRTAGVAAVAAISAASGAAATAVAGAATVTCTATLAAVGGAVGATNTIDVQVTISRSGGSSANHTCLVYAVLMNANVTGITIA